MEQQDLYTEYRKHLKERILTVAMRRLSSMAYAMYVWTTSQQRLLYQKERYTRLTRTRKSCCLMA